MVFTLSGRSAGNLLQSQVPKIHLENMAVLLNEVFNTSTSLKLNLEYQSLVRARTFPLLPNLQFYTDNKVFCCYSLEVRCWSIMNHYAFLLKCSLIFYVAVPTRPHSQLPTQP